MDSRNQQLLTKFFVIEKYDISAFHSRVNRPHMFFKNEFNEIVNHHHIFHFFMILKNIDFHGKIQINSKSPSNLAKGWSTRIQKAETSQVLTKNILSTLVDFFNPYFRFEIPLGLSKMALFRYFIWFLSQQKSTNVDQIFCY